MSTPPRVALTRAEAARSLGVSLTTFERNIQPDLRVVKLGQRVLVPVAELHRWTESHAARGAA